MTKVTAAAPAPHATSTTLRIAAVGDLHCSKGSAGSLAPLFAEVAKTADVLLLCGDLTDYGLPEEAHLLITELAAAERIPIVAVLGNHDYESGKPDEVKKVLVDAGIHVLDGDGVVLHGVGFAGVKGYVGGFGDRALQAWGESSLKHLVHEASEEAIKLERALARLPAARRVALLHYSPIEATVAGEPSQIYAWLGSSRLEEPLNRYSVSAVFHGHAHYGHAEGKTTSGAPVYNVSMPLMKRLNGAERAFRLTTIKV